MVLFHMSHMYKHLKRQLVDYEGKQHHPKGRRFFHKISKYLQQNNHGPGYLGSGKFCASAHSIGRGTPTPHRSDRMPSNICRIFTPCVSLHTGTWAGFYWCFCSLTGSVLGALRFPFSHAQLEVQYALHRLDPDIDRI